MIIESCNNLAVSVVGYDNSITRSPTGVRLVTVQVGKKEQPFGEFVQRDERVEKSE